MSVLLASLQACTQAIDFIPQTLPAPDQGWQTAEVIDSAANGSNAVYDAQIKRVGLNHAYLSATVDAASTGNYRSTLWAYTPALARSKTDTSNGYTKLKTGSQSVYETSLAVIENSAAVDFYTVLSSGATDLYSLLSSVPGENGIHIAVDPYIPPTPTAFGRQIASVWSSSSSILSAHINNAQEIELNAIDPLSAAAISTALPDTANDLALGFDGTNSVLVYRDLTNVLYSINLNDSTYTPEILSTMPTPLVQGYSMASNSSGITVVVFLAQDPSINSANCTITDQKLFDCKTRVYASVRMSDGSWVGPSRLDVSTGIAQENYYSSVFNPTSFNPPAIDDNNMYAIPKITYTGNNQFLVTWVTLDRSSHLGMTGYSTATYSKTKLFSRVYTAGTGWDVSPTLIETSVSMTPQDSSCSDCYRMTSTLDLSSDEAGNALLVRHGITTDSLVRINRVLGVKAQKWNTQTGWQSAERIAGTSTFLKSDAVFYPRISSALFPSGEAIVSFIWPDFLGYKRLYSVEYKK